MAAHVIGDAYYWGRGVAIDHPRAMAAYKIAAEAGDALSQWQVGMMYCHGHGVSVDYDQARAWLEKAAAQDDPAAFGELGFMYVMGQGVTPSWRRARELYQRAIELGDSLSVENMQTLTESIANVTSSEKPPHTISTQFVSIHTSIHPIPSRSAPPSWTSGWRSTVRAART